MVNSVTLKNETFSITARGERSQLPKLSSGSMFRESNRHMLYCSLGGEKGRRSAELYFSAFCIFPQYELIAFNTNYVVATF